jgi:hypothetical protein
MSLLPFGHSPLSGNEIRALRVLRIPQDISNADDYLECELSHIELDQTPGFHALSYVWGEGSVPIFVNGRFMRVTANLSCRPLPCLDNALLR